jgi:hypothetical protein
MFRMNDNYYRIISINKVINLDQVEFHGFFMPPSSLCIKIRNNNICGSLV